MKYDKDLLQKIVEEYNKTPSLRILTKKYKKAPLTIKKHLLKAGGKLNFEKGSLRNYKRNSGTFEKGMVPWNKNKKMSKEFCKMRRKIMKQKMKQEDYVPISLLPGVAEKISKSKMGKNNPNWKNGITPVNQRKRGLLIKDKWRDEVLKRDNYTCQICHSHLNLKAHHIKPVVKYPSLANDINNGITLCEFCHYLTYKHEKEYETYLQNILKGFIVITITSTRPCLIRQSLILNKLDLYLGKNHIHVYTGQNFDEHLYKNIIQDLKLRTPDYEFNLKEKLSDYQFMGNCMVNIENLLKKFNPQNTIINVLGDVNGAFASAYIAKRMGFKIVHNESGNRANVNILEEINRKALDSLSDKLLCYTQRSRENLLREGYKIKDIIVCGNPLTEVLTYYFKNFKKAIRKDNYILVTLHRHETINNFERLKNITRALNTLSKIYNYKIVLSVHPSLQNKIKSNILIKRLFDNIELHSPFTYTNFLNLMKHSKALISDSGGECEEACILKVPCLVIRNETERNELLEHSQMILCGINEMNIVRSFKIVIDLPIVGIPEEYTKPTSSIVTKLLLSYNI